jgi:hypothetical protein
VNDVRLPAFFRIILSVMIVGLVILAGSTMQTNRRLCEQRAETRDDGRAVWMYLVAREPERRDDAGVASPTKRKHCKWVHTQRPSSVRFSPVSPPSRLR